MELSLPNPFSRMRRGERSILFSSSPLLGERDEGFTDFYIKTVFKYLTAFCSLKISIRPKPEALTARVAGGQSFGFLYLFIAVASYVRAKPKPKRAWRRFAPPRSFGIRHLDKAIAGICLNRSWFNRLPRIARL